MTNITIHPEAVIIRNEPCFELFMHEGLFCLIQRMMRTGHLCGYVAVPESNSLYGKSYRDKIVVEDFKEISFNGNYIGLLCTDAVEIAANIVSLDMAIDVHCGLTYSKDSIKGIEGDVLGKLWWFGFDTAHSGDLQPFQDDISRMFPISDNTYKDYDFVREETKKLASQISKFSVT